MGDLFLTWWWIHINKFVHHYVRYQMTQQGLVLETLSWHKNMDDSPQFSNVASDWLQAELPANQKPH